MAKQTTVRLPDDLADDAEAVARVRGDSVNQLIIDALAAEIERVRSDDDFTARAKKLLEGDREILDRLAQVTRYLSLAEFWYLAEHVTGINPATLIKASRVELADSALHAPQAGFGDTDFYPDVYDKASVLACRIAWNHPLPDGNKRAAWACLVLFIDLNDGSWNDEQPDVDDAVEAMLAVAAREVDENWLADWLRDRVTFQV